MCTYVDKCVCVCVCVYCSTKTKMQSRAALLDQNLVPFVQPLDSLFQPFQLRCASIAMASLLLAMASNLRVMASK